MAHPSIQDLLSDESRQKLKEQLKVIASADGKQQKYRDAGKNALLTINAYAEQTTELQGENAELQTKLEVAEAAAKTAKEEAAKQTTELQGENAELQTKLEVAEAAAKTAKEEAAKQTTELQTKLKAAEAAAKTAKEETAKQTTELQTKLKAAEAAAKTAKEEAKTAKEEAKTAKEEAAKQTTELQTKLEAAEAAAEAAKEELQTKFEDAVKEGVKEGVKAAKEEAEAIKTAKEETAKQTTELQTKLKAAEAAAEAAEKATAELQDELKAKTKAVEAVEAAKEEAEAKQKDQLITLISNIFAMKSGELNNMELSIDKDTKKKVSEMSNEELQKAILPVFQTKVEAVLKKAAAEAEKAAAEAEKAAAEKAKTEAEKAAEKAKTEAVAEQKDRLITLLSDIFATKGEELNSMELSIDKDTKKKVSEMSNEELQKAIIPAFYTKFEDAVKEGVKFAKEEAIKSAQEEVADQIAKLKSQLEAEKIKAAAEKAKTEAEKTELTALLSDIFATKGVGLTEMTLPITKGNEGNEDTKKKVSEMSNKELQNAINIHVTEQLAEITPVETSQNAMKTDTQNAKYKKILEVLLSRIQKAPTVEGKSTTPTVEGESTTPTVEGESTTPTVEGESTTPVVTQQDIETLKASVETALAERIKGITEEDKGKNNFNYLSLLNSKVGLGLSLTAAVLIDLGLAYRAGTTSYTGWLFSTTDTGKALYCFLSNKGCDIIEKLSSLFASCYEYAASFTR